MEKPILFNTEMIQAILEGRKSVTRRILKLPKYVEKQEDGLYTLFAEGSCYQNQHLEEIINYLSFPYKIGDILYVRESALIQSMKNLEKKVKMLFKADNQLLEFSVSDEEYNRLLKYEHPKNRWLSPYWLTKETARIFLKVTDVRVERLQDITEEQAINEGVKLPSPKANYINSFIPLWDSTIKEKELDKYGWDANPWVWVIEFEKFDR